MAYKISIDPAAMRELKKLDPKARQQVADAISALASNPRPHGVKKLSTSKKGHRIRVGDYRVLYEVTDKKVMVVLVLKIAHRRDVYR